MGMWAICIALSVAAATHAAEPISFRNLRKGQRLEVSFQSTGCFSSYRYKLTFRREKCLKVTIRESEDGWARNDDDKPSKLVGSLDISAKQAKLLDNLLGFYRTKQTVHSSTVDQVKLSLQEEGVAAVNERYVDSSGLTDLDRKYAKDILKSMKVTIPEMLSIHELVREARKQTEKSKRGKTPIDVRDVSPR